MCRKMIKHRIAIVGIAILAFLSVACASVPESTEYRETSPRELRDYLRDYYRYHRADENVKIVTKTRLEIVQSNFIRLRDADVEAFVGENLEDSLLTNRIETDKVYRVYITSRGSSFLIIDQIDGLIPIEEAQAKIDQKNAERIAIQEAERQAREEANRYDPSKFIIAPSDFSPAHYTGADLFDAVAASEKLDIAPIGYWGNTPVYHSKNFVSDVVFVSQNGTDITFRTADNAINKRMKVDSRTSLTAGQKVRIYYTAYRIQAWQIIAIERL